MQLRLLLGPATSERARICGRNKEKKKGKKWSGLNHKRTYKAPSNSLLIHTTYLPKKRKPFRLSEILEREGENERCIG